MQKDDDTKTSIFCKKFVIISSICLCFIIVIIITLLFNTQKLDYKLKTIEKNYAPSMEIPNIYYYTEYKDDSWYEGELEKSGEREIGYGIKAVEYKGKIYKWNRW